MRHSSIKIANAPCEFINVTPINPMISKCYIKVCYVGDESNRNKSIITKDVARQMANSLPGSPIVGFYNDYKGDFEEHNKVINIGSGNIEMKEVTRPYGFVDWNAKCWFQKFLDDGKNEHEYLMTEGWLWTGQYPEVRRVLNKGNNQSMNIDNEFTSGTWTKDNKGMPEFFIVNEAIITNLCILGEDQEPCFEGSTITGGEFSNEESPVIQFSLDENFKEEILSMMQELKKALNKGGSRMFTTYAVTVGDSLWTNLYSYVNEKMPGQKLYGCFEEGEQKFAVLHNEEENKFYRLNFSLSEDTFSPADEVSELTDFSQENQFKAEDVEAFEAEFKKKKDDEEEDKNGKGDNPKPEDKSEGNNEPEDDDDKEDPEDDSDEDDDEKKKKKTKYNLDDVVEYQELLSKYNDLQTRVNELETENQNLTSEIEPLRQFKLETDRKDKEAMIQKFYMLTDEDKKDVIENIDTYSLDDIEAKLSIICVRNKVSFNLEDENEKPPFTFNFDGNEGYDASTPAWVKAALEVAKDME